METLREEWPYTGPHTKCAEITKSQILKAKLLFLHHNDVILQMPNKNHWTDM